MSESINVRTSRKDFRKLLLATVSAAALVVSVGTEQGKAADGDTAPFWIELGGQFATLEKDQDMFLPPFLLTTPRPSFDVASPAAFEKAPASSWDGSAKVSFEPSGSDWVFSVGVLYGKSTRQVYRAQETAHPTPQYNFNYSAYQTFAVRSDESHTVLDFQAGRDVGLGMFGSGGNSTVSFGVRYAQFNSRNNVGIKSKPINVNFYYPYHKFYGIFSATRKFTGVGPSLSWDASADLIGHSLGGSIGFDWGVNGAILFGRQRAKAYHQTANINQTIISNYQRQRHTTYQTASPSRNREAIVPNLGGFAGVSWRLPNAKVSVGYRADFFFGAKDGGIDAAHRENVGFFGPFATVSVGLGG